MSEAYGYYTYGDEKAKHIVGTSSYGIKKLNTDINLISKEANCYIKTLDKDLTYTLKNTVSKNSVCYYHNLNKSANIHLYYKETDLTSSTPEYIKINEDTFSFSSDVNGYYEIGLEGQIATHNVTINAQPETAITKINNTEQNTYIAVDTEDLNWEVSAEGYVSQSGEILNIHESKVLDITLLEAVLLTITCNIENATILINGIEGASQKVAKGEEITYVVSAPNYKTKTETLILNEDTVIEVELESMDISIVFPGTTLPSSVTYSSSYFSNTGSYLYSTNTSHSSTGWAYLKFTTPNRATTLSVQAYTSSENNWDFGAVYVGTAIFHPKYSDIRSGATDGQGTYLYSGSGANSSYSTYSMTLSANTTYYINLVYSKDSSGSSNSDRFYVRNITFTVKG